MLVITRRSGESFMIGDDIEISIIEVAGDKAKVGISAPREIRILRRELIDELRSANTQAASVGGVSLETLVAAVRGDNV